MFSLFKKKVPPSAAPVVVVPRIKHKNFSEAVSSIPGMTDSTRPIMDALAGDLLLTYAIDIGTGYQMLSQASLEQHRLPRESLQTSAKCSALPALRTIKTRTDGTVHELTAGDNMAACSMLFPELWDQIEEQTGGDVLALFPHRDAVYFSRADAPNAVEALKRIVSQINFSDTHALSQLIYRRVGREWQALEA